MRRGDTLRLRAESLTFGGDTLARADDGRVVFFAGGAPGDEVEVTIEEVKPRFARGSLSSVVKLGPDRVEARCPLVPVCGGCQWQEVSLDAQRAAKQAIVTRALGRLGAEVRPIVTPTEAFHYRTRARLTVGDNGAIGFQARRSHAVIDVPHCPLLDPALDRAFSAARAIAGPLLRPGATISGQTGTDGNVHLSIEGLRDPGPRTIDRLRPLLAASGTGGTTSTTGIIGFVADGQREGASSVNAGDSDMTFRQVADGFAQATHAGNRALRALVIEALGGPHARVLELFAGDGNFTRDLTHAAHEVLAVEGDRAACARLVENVTGPGRITALAEPAEDAARRLASVGERFDAAVLDPPRTGAPSLLDSLFALAPRVVYVSCDPMTLARDAAALQKLGLHPIRATPIDLMPHTFHVETVCLFERR